MPRVPSYDGPQVRDAATAQPYQRTPDAGANLRAVAGGLNQLGESVDRVVQRQDQDTAWRAQAAINQEWVAFDAEARKQSQGQNAAGYAGKVQAWWKTAAETYGKELNPSARSLVAKNLTVAQGQAYASALQFENTELERSRVQALDGALSAEISRGSAGGPSAAAASVGIIDSMLKRYGAETGKPPEWVAQQTLARTTALHANVIGSLLQSDPKAAETYFNANKAQIDGARHDEIGGSITRVTATTEGDNAAGAIWAQLGPKTDLQPVELDKLEQAARDQFKNDPARRDAALAGIRARTQAFEHAERQRAAGNTNTVFGLLDQGVPLVRIQASPAWNALPEKDQRQIRLSLEQEAAAREGRAAARESREFTALQRRDHMLLLNNGGDYLTASDPAVLSQLTREQVVASRAKFGMEGAQHLLQRWDALQKPGAVAEARIDQDDFNHVAEQLGLRPYENGKSEVDKRALGELKYRVEQLIDQQQRATKKAMTRKEKGELMSAEMAKQVTTSHWLWGDEKVPVIRLAPEQVANVVVPPADRQQIIEALQQMYKRTQNPIYAPTDETMRRLYLTKQSRAAALIPDAK
jgi:hypothetical protein